MRSAAGRSARSSRKNHTLASEVTLVANVSKTNSPQQETWEHRSSSIRRSTKQERRRKKDLLPKTKLEKMMSSMSPLPTQTQNHQSLPKAPALGPKRLSYRTVAMKTSNKFSISNLYKLMEAAACKINALKWTSLQTISRTVMMMKALGTSTKSQLTHFHIIKKPALLRTTVKSNSWRSHATYSSPEI